MTLGGEREGTPRGWRLGQQVGVRKLYLILAGLLGVASAVVPSLAAGDPAASASFTAVDYSWNAGGGGHQVTIAPGGTVSFGYPSGVSQHNADFGAGSQPTSCTQSAGTNGGAVPPLPHSPTAPGWSGSCTFNTPGTYSFHCDLHPSMVGTIVVQAPGTTTGTTTITTGPTSPEPTIPTTGGGGGYGGGGYGGSGGGSGSGGHTGGGGPPARTASVASRQRGFNVRGSVVVNPAGAGGQLEVDVFTASRGLSARSLLVRVGRLVRREIASGRQRFTVPLNATARRALRRHGRLGLSVTVIVRSPSNATRTTRTSVVLRPS